MTEAVRAVLTGFVLIGLTVAVSAGVFELLP
jgi:hypothetical protein